MDVEGQKRTKVPIKSSAFTEEAVVNVDEYRMQLQTQLTSNQIEILFAKYLQYLEGENRRDDVSMVSVNLREISSFNVEVIKERFRDFSENVQKRFEENSEEINSRKGLYQQGLTFEFEAQGPQGMLDPARGEEAERLLTDLTAKVQEDEAGFGQDLADLATQRTKLKSLVKSKVNMQTLTQLEHLEDWLETQREVFRVPKNAPSGVSGLDEVTSEKMRRQYLKNVNGRPKIQEMVKKDMAGNIALKEKVLNAFK